MTGLHAKNIKKLYQGRPVLDVDTTFQSGNLYAILGPNGSGKSTLLQILSLVRKSDYGDVIITNDNGEMPINMELRRRIVLVPDRQGLFNDTVINNVVYGLKIRKVNKIERGKIVKKAVRAVGLWNLRHSNALRLSTGEAQRLCLAMAIALEPEIILLDEPTSSLDPYNVSLIEDIIRQMKDTAKIVLLVTHNIFQAKRLSDRVVFLFQGRLVEEMATEHFFKQPESEIAKRFIDGEMVY